MLNSSVLGRIRSAFITITMLALSAQAASVDVYPTFFSPSSLQITVGETVTWTNQDEEDVHTVASSNGSWSTGYLFSYGETFSVTFNSAGTFNYSDSINGFSGSITVIGVPANVPPTVALTSPTNNIKLPSPATFTLTATASDSDGSVTNVNFYLEAGTTLVGSDTSSPYTLTISNLAAGTYTYYATATDNKGASTVTAQSVRVYAITNTVISAPRVVGTNFIFDIAVISGHSYSVETSTNLAAPSPWPVTQNFTAQSNSFRFTQPRGIGQTNKFFRVRSN